MEARLSRSEILGRLEAEYQRLLDTVLSLTPAQATQPGVIGEWSVKDMLAHLIYWNMLPVNELQFALRGERFRDIDETSDQINARMVAQYRHYTLDEVLSTFANSYTLVWDTISHLPEAAFEPGNPIETALDETIHGAVANNTYEHWPIHQAQIAEWLAQQRT
jgi:uncharacterized protein (TIGR03083 family)